MSETESFVLRAIGLWLFWGLVLWCIYCWASGAGLDDDGGER